MLIIAGGGSRAAMESLREMRRARPASRGCALREGNGERTAGGDRRVSQPNPDGDEITDDYAPRRPGGWCWRTRRCAGCSSPDCATVWPELFGTPRMSCFMCRPCRPARALAIAGFRRDQVVPRIIYE